MKKLNWNCFSFSNWKIDWKIWKLNFNWISLIHLFYLKIELHLIIIEIEFKLLNWNYSMNQLIDILKIENSIEYEIEYILVELLFNCNHFELSWISFKKEMKIHFFINSKLKRWNNHYLLNMKIKIQLKMKLKWFLLMITNKLKRWKLKSIEILILSLSMK